MAGINLIIPGQGEIGKWHSGDGKTANLFLQCSLEEPTSDKILNVMFFYVSFRVLRIFLCWYYEQLKTVELLCEKNNIFGTLDSTYNEQQEKTLSLLSTLYSTVVYILYTENEGFRIFLETSYIFYTP
jgi:hypothetical protein